MKNIKIIWFDQMKGIGEAVDKNGELIFINSFITQINKKSRKHFFLFKKGFKTKCQTKRNKDGSLLAKTIF